MENRAFLEMFKAAKSRLDGKSPFEISEKTKIEFSEETSEFILHSLGKEIHVSYPEYVISSEIDGWHYLLILHYMDNADGTIPGSELISFADLKDGMVRGGGFDRLCENTIRTKLGDVAPEKVQEICEKLGGKALDSNADLCMVFPFLPLYPITLKIWFADDEIEGSGRMLLNSSADHFLSVEDAVTAGTLIMEEIVKQL